MELNKKLTLAGFYPAQEIKVRDIGPQIGINLAFVVIMRGGEGKFAARVEVLNPRGGAIIPANELPVELQKGRPALHLIKIQGFPLAEAGTYEVRVTLDTTAYRRTFEIFHDPTLTEV